MGLTSRWWEQAKGELHPVQLPAAPAPGNAASANRPSGAYSLQGEEDLFRDPFADFAPSRR